MRPLSTFTSTELFFSPPTLGSASGTTSNNSPGSSSLRSMDISLGVFPPSPLRGRGDGGEGRIHHKRRPPPHPNPLPRGEREPNHSGNGCPRVSGANRRI